MNLPNKFQCHYKLTLQYEDDKGNVYHSIVTDPITISFNIQKATFSNYNVGTVTVYNLDAVTRQGIYQDRLLLNPEKRKFLTLEAGYGDNLTLVLFGTIQQCYSERKGVDFITQIEVIDPDILNQYTSVTFAAGTTFEEAYKFLVSALPTLEQGECGDLNGTFKTPTTFDGNTFWAINELTGGHTFIDNKVINTLNDNEVLKGYKALLISAETGLLDTPKRYDAILEVRMLFEPTIRIGQLVELQSATWNGFDGQYKVLGYTHNCVISGAVGGTRITTIQLQYAEELTNSNVNLTNNPQGSQPSYVQNNRTIPVNINVSGDVKQIYKYIKKGDLNSIKKAKLTERISWWEMLYSDSDNTINDVKNAITENKLAYCKQIAIKLTEFLNMHFKGKTIKINSGYRTPQSNQATEGSAKNSNHLYGMAIDFRVNEVPFKQYASAFADKNKWKLGVIPYSKKQFVHVSLNPNERVFKYY